MIISINPNKNTVSKVENKTISQIFEDLKNQGFVSVIVSNKCLAVYKNDLYKGAYIECTQHEYTGYKLAAEILKQITDKKEPYRMDTFRAIWSKEMCLFNPLAVNYFNDFKKDINLSEYWILNPELKGGEPFGFDDLMQLFIYLKPTRKQYHE